MVIMQAFTTHTHTHTSARAHTTITAQRLQYQTYYIIKIIIGRISSTFCPPMYERMSACGHVCEWVGFLVESISSTRQCIPFERKSDDIHGEPWMRTRQRYKLYLPPSVFLLSLLSLLSILSLSLSPLDIYLLSHKSTAESYPLRLSPHHTLYA